MYVYVCMCMYVFSCSLLFFLIPFSSYGIVYQHGYLEVETAVSVVTTKVKGADALLTDSSAEWMVNCPNSHFNWTVLDHTDLVVPPQVNSRQTHRDSSQGQWSRARQGRLLPPHLSPPPPKLIKG